MLISYFPAIFPAMFFGGRLSLQSPYFPAIFPVIFSTMTHLGGNASTASIDNDVLDRSRNFYERRREGKKMVAVAIVTQQAKRKAWLACIPSLMLLKTRDERLQLCSVVCLSSSLACCSGIHNYCVVHVCMIVTPEQHSICRREPQTYYELQTSTA